MIINLTSVARTKDLDKIVLTTLFYVMADQSFPSMPIPPQTGICQAFVILSVPCRGEFVRKPVPGGGAFVNIYNHSSLNFFGFNLIL